MNKSVTEVLQNRKSYRNYSDQKLSEETLLNILQTAQRTGSSKDRQEISIIYVSDRNLINEINQVSGQQQQIADCQYLLVFVVDYNRSSARSKEAKVMNELENLTTAAIDCGLMAQSVELLCQEQNLGTCMIGSIRKDMVKVKELLNLTGYTYPLLGMTVAYNKEEESNLRPRADFKTFAFNNKYNEQAVKEGALKYDTEMMKFWEQLGLERFSYLDKMDDALNNTYYRNEIEQFHQMGFLTNLEKKKN